MFIGWGKRNISKTISEKKAIVLNYSYFSIFFVFTLTFQYQYKLATLLEEGWHYKDMTKEEATQLLGGTTFVPNLWLRFSLLALIALILIGALISPLLPRP